jgi:intraflagellar transport protein 88
VRRGVLVAARLVADKIERGGYAAGYDWCCAQLRQAGLARLANELELAKASRHLAAMDFSAAIAVYKVGREAGRLGTDGCFLFPPPEGWGERE